MTFPLLFDVGVHRYTAGSSQGYGETSDDYTPPKDSAGTAVKVYGWSTPKSDEPKLAGHDRIIVDLELLIPPDMTLGPYDLVDVDGVQYEVIGEPEDYNHGFHAWQPGRVANLRKVSG